MGKLLKKAVAVIILLVFATLLWLAFQRSTGDSFPTIFGYGYAKVASGSMEPAIHVGELVVVDTRSQVHEGDVIMYLDSDSRLITHRVIYMDAEQLITQGDANDIADTPIVAASVVGVIIWHGQLDILASHPLLQFPGVILTLLFAALLIRWAFIELFQKSKM